MLWCDTWGMFLDGSGIYLYLGIEKGGFEVLGRFR